MVTPAVKREAVAHLKAHLGLSERRACQIAGADRKMVRYQSQRAPDTVLRGRLRDLANERRRFGYRRLFVLLRREGEASGINRIYRLYREEGLTAVPYTHLTLPTILRVLFHVSLVLVTLIHFYYSHSSRPHYYLLLFSSLL